MNGQTKKRVEHRLCIRLNENEREKLDKLLTRTHIKQNTLIQRLCLGELVPLKKPPAYYETLRYINSIGDRRLKFMYRYADDPEVAWDKICNIEDARSEAIGIIRDFV